MYLAGRNTKTGQDAALKLHNKTGNPAIHFLHLDLKDFSSIHAFVKSFLKCESHMSVLNLSYSKEVLLQYRTYQIVEKIVN